MLKTLEEVKIFEHINQPSLSKIENLKEAHTEYELLQKNCQEGIVYSVVKLGEIYINAKLELGSHDKPATNETVGKLFGKTEATVRNYIKIANNRHVIFETPVSDLLSIRNMLAIIDGRATQNEDGSITKKESTKKTSESKEQSDKEIIKSLIDENKKLKSKVLELEKSLKMASILTAKVNELVSKGE